MLRITIEEVPEPQAVPRGSARRETDMLYPTAMMEPKLIYQQGWLEGETHPNVQMLIGLLNGLDVPLVCADCGHQKDEHDGGQGRCEHSGRMYSNDTCSCRQYLTAQQQWNQATLKANAAHVVHEGQLTQENQMLIGRIQVQTEAQGQLQQKIDRLRKRVSKGDELRNQRARERQ